MALGRSVHTAIMGASPLHSCSRRALEPSFIASFGEVLSLYSGQVQRLSTAPSPFVAPVSESTSQRSAEQQTSVHFMTPIIQCESAPVVLGGQRDTASPGPGSSEKERRVLGDGPSFQDFLRRREQPISEQAQGPLETGRGRKRVYVETYGCQMNEADSQVVLSVLGAAGYSQAGSTAEADVVLLNTCAIRDGAEQRIWSRLGTLRGPRRSHRRREAGSGVPLVGVLGCMAERLKERLFQHGLVDVVAGPDAYRDLPRLLQAARGEGGGEGEAGAQHTNAAINVQLSVEETYADITPLRPAGAVSAFLSIMRGCNNMCTFCIVPFTRGRERSRPAASILDEVRLLSDAGVKEVTLLGQNVNSYADSSAGPLSWPPSAAAPPSEDPFAVYAQGFTSVYRPRREGALRFAELLHSVAGIDPEMRVRFTSPHPKDFSPEVLQVIAGHNNVCKQLHMPAQSGSSSVLQYMRRGYTREAYDALVRDVRASIPGVALSTDMIAGFCGETEEDHAASVDLMRRTSFEHAFMFAFSQRERTHAARHLQDDVPEEVKARRLQEIIAAFREQAAAKSRAEVGRRHLVLVEGPARRDPLKLTGRTCTNKRVVILGGANAQVPSTYSPRDALTHHSSASGGRVRIGAGDYVAVEIRGAGTLTLEGLALARTTLREFVSVHGSTFSVAPRDLVHGNTVGVAAPGDVKGPVDALVGPSWWPSRDRDPLGASKPAEILV